MGRSIGNAHSLVGPTVWLCLCVLVVSAHQGVHSDEIILEWKQIFLNILGGPSFSLIVEPDETGVDLRRDIYEVEGIPDSPLVPMVGDTLVEFTNRLSDYNISDGTILTVDVHDHRSNKTVEFQVRTLDGKQLQVTTELGNSVASLKDNITQWTGIPQTEQRLLRDGKEFKNDHKLLHYGVHSDTILNLGRPLEDCRRVVTIFVMTLSGATIELDVNLADTLTDLKEKIWEKSGVPANVQRLTFDRRIINGMDHLCDLGMEAGSTVYMYLYSAHITSLDQVARLKEPSAAYPVNSRRAPIFHEAEDSGEPVQRGSHRPASIYKDSRNWLARNGHRPFFVNEIFDQVAHLVPNPDSGASINSYQESLEIRLRPNASESDRYAAVLMRARLNLTMAVRPYRVAANLTSANGRSPGITLGGGTTDLDPRQLVPLGADVNNWAPDALGDPDLMRLFEVSERVRQVLARAAQTGEGILCIANQKRINSAILYTYIGALAGYPQAVEHSQPGEGEGCGICMDELAAEPALKLSCEHTYHADCLLPWAVDLLQTSQFPKCPFCEQRFTFPYESLGKAVLGTSELQANQKE